MPYKEKTWHEIVAKADVYLSIDQTSHYLSLHKTYEVGEYIDVADYPWEFVTSFKPGGGHRMDIETSIWFEAIHPAGLLFQWSYDLEPRKPNGEHAIDVVGCKAIIRLLPSKLSAEFATYLKDGIKKVLEKGAQYQKTVDDFYKTAADLLEASDV